MASPTSRNPWQLESILELEGSLPDDWRPPTFMLFLPAGSWLVLFALIAPSLQAVLCGVLLLLYSFVLGVQSLRQVRISSVARLLVVSFAVTPAISVLFTSPILLGLNRFGIVASFRSLLLFEALGIVLGATSGAVWGVGYLWAARRLTSGCS